MGGIALYALAFWLFATGQLGLALLVTTGATVMIVKAHGGREPAVPHIPRRMAETIDEKTGEVLAADSDWRAVMAAVTTHVAMTGCLCTQRDFTNKAGVCPMGGRYSEHPAK